MASGTVTINGQTHTDPNGCYNIDGGQAEITYDIDAPIAVYSEANGKGDTVSSVGGGNGTITIAPAGSVVIG
jgi:hypothetical protein